MADCLPQRSHHPLKLSLERIQVSLRKVSVAIDRPLQLPRPGPIGIIHYGVENLLALGIQQLGRDKVLTNCRDNARLLSAQVQAE